MHRKQGRAWRQHLKTLQTRARKHTNEKLRGAGENTQAKNYGGRRKTRKRETAADTGGSNGSNGVSNGSRTGTMTGTRTGTKTGTGTGTGTGPGRDRDRDSDRGSDRDRGGDRDRARDTDRDRDRARDSDRDPVAILAHAIFAQANSRRCLRCCFGLRTSAFELHSMLARIRSALLRTRRDSQRALSDWARSSCKVPRGARKTAWSSSGRAKFSGVAAPPRKHACARQGIRQCRCTQPGLCGIFHISVAAGT
jgi:hypothetical protein